MFTIKNIDDEQNTPKDNNNDKTFTGFDWSYLINFNDNLYFDFTPCFR